MNTHETGISVQRIATLLAQGDVNSCVEIKSMCTSDVLLTCLLWPDEFPAFEPDKYKLLHFKSLPLFAQWRKLEFYSGLWFLNPPDMWDTYTIELWKAVPGLCDALKECPHDSHSQFSWELLRRMFPNEKRMSPSFPSSGNPPSLKNAGEVKQRPKQKQLLFSTPTHGNNTTNTVVEYDDEDLSFSMPHIIEQQKPAELMMRDLKIDHHYDDDTMMMMQ